MQITAISEAALCCTLPPPAMLEKQQRLWVFARILRELPSITEVVVGMNNITLFSHYGTDLAELTLHLETLWQQTRAEQYQGRSVQIPVNYGGEFGEDLYEVAKYHQISVQQVVEIHCRPIYTVYMIGFQAGFPYLGGLPEILHTPRRATPRTLVPAGSVGIGGSQTGIYPFASPGGWQLIGHTSLPLFDKSQTPPTLLQAGDNVQFVMESIEL